MSHSRHQARLLKQLASYVELTNPALAHELIDNGYCFGFAICDAVMHRLGKAKWWSELKKLIAEWDHSEESLLKTYFLSDAERPQTLEALFNQALDYVVLNQAEKRNILPFKNFQDSFLRPTPTKQSSKEEKRTPIQEPSKSLQFELSVKDEKENKNQVVTAQSYTSFGGHFEKDTLVALLEQNKQTIANSICLISGNLHTTALCVDADGWYFYDSQDPSGEAQKFTPAETSQLAACIQASLSCNLGLECFSYQENPLKLNTDSVTFKPKCKTNQQEISHLTAKSRVKEMNGLRQMVRYSSAEDHDLIRLFEHAAHDRDLFVHIKSLLRTRNQENNRSIALHLGIHAPFAFLETLRMEVFPLDQLKLFFAVIKRRANFSDDNLSNALSQQDKYGSTGLHKFIQYAPKHFPELLKLISIKKFRASIAEALATKDSIGRTGFTLLKSCAPEWINLLDFIRLHEPDTTVVDAEKCVTKLIEEAKTQEQLDTILDLAYDVACLNQVPNTAQPDNHFHTSNGKPVTDAFVKLIKKAEQKSNQLCLRKTPLESSVSHTKSPYLHILAKHANKDAHTLIELFEKVEANPSLCANLAQSLLMVKNGETGLQILLRCAPAAVQRLLQLAQHKPHLRDSLAQALLICNNNQKNLLEFLADKKYQMLPELIYLARIDKKISTSLMTLLAARNKDNHTGLYIVATQAPSCLSALLDIADIRFRNDANKLLEAAIDNATNTKDVRQLVKLASQIKCLNNGGMFHPKFDTTVSELGPNAVAKLYERGKEKIIALPPDAQDDINANLQFLQQKAYFFDNKNWVMLYQSSQYKLTLSSLRC